MSNLKVHLQKITAEWNVSNRAGIDELKNAQNFGRFSQVFYAVFVWCAERMVVENWKNVYTECTVLDTKFRTEFPSWKIEHIVVYCVQGWKEAQRQVHHVE